MYDVYRQANFNQWHQCLRANDIATMNNSLGPRIFGYLDCVGQHLCTIMAIRNDTNLHNFNLLKNFVVLKMFYCFILDKITTVFAMKHWFSLSLNELFQVITTHRGYTLGTHFQLDSLHRYI